MTKSKADIAGASPSLSAALRRFDGVCIERRERAAGGRVLSPSPLYLPMRARDTRTSHRQQHRIK